MDETTEVPETSQTEADTLVDETPVLETTDGSVTEETMEVIEYPSRADLFAVRDDLLHADLYGSFLICGTLLGIALFWRITQ